MTLTPTQSGLVEFRPRARLLKLLGSELISDDILAITELVKNAHDADASSVSIEFHGITGADGWIVIKDDGHGMDLDALLRHWMQPAGTSKVNPRSRVSKRGRRVLGEKGVGRFAADKLARSLELVSKCAGERNEIFAQFDWDQFDTDDRLLSEIKNRWETRAPVEIQKQGTILRMRGLRSAWNERMFRRLCTRLSRLRSPFAGHDGFTITIQCDDFPQYSGELRSDILDRAPYRVDAVFDGDQSIELNLNGSKSVEHLWNGHGDLRCGPVRVRIFAFDLETEAVARIGPRMEVRAWLREWTGVSVFRDGFRVWPYGEPHDDWLRLDQRRVNNPVVKLSNNQVIGFVEITRDANPGLADQTNREGLIQSRAFEDLRRLISFVIQLLEAERQRRRHPTVKARSGGNAKQTNDASMGVVGDLEKLAQSAPRPLSNELKRVVARLRQEGATEALQSRLVVEGYSELAAVGQAAIGLTRSLNPMFEQLAARIGAVRSSVRGRADKGATSALAELEVAAKALADRISMLKPVEEGSHRRRAMDVPVELDSFRELTGPMIAAQGVRFTADVPRGGVLRVEMRPESFHRILHILTNNSLEWLRKTASPEIKVQANVRADRCEIVFSDNGPGISSELADRVFDPLFSGREGGRGMGLTIARNIVEAHGGRIDVIVDGRRRGANIRLVLPRKRSRATLHTN
jgi:signal transduction histidine kinase